MVLNRRAFVTLAAGGAIAATAGVPDQGLAADGSKIKAIAFDGFPIIDPRPVFAKVTCPVLAVIGDSTASAARVAGLDPDIVAADQTSEGLADAIAAYFEQR